jgi:hypothetical protein
MEDQHINSFAKKQQRKSFVKPKQIINTEYTEYWGRWNENG